MSISEVLDDLNESADRDLGAVVLALDAIGKGEQADLLVACELGYDFEDEWMEGMGVRPALHTDPAVSALITDETIAFLGDQCERLRSDGFVKVYSAVNVRLRTPAADWRERRREVRERGERTVNNQGTSRSVAAVTRKDRLQFDSPAEVRVYDALVRRQATLPPESTIAILPGPGARVLGRTRWPDFLVTYRGRVGMIEVDGHHHNGRAAADRSRDSLLSDAGIKHVERIAAEDTISDSELDTFVERFLQRLDR